MPGAGAASTKNGISVYRAASDSVMMAAELIKSRKLNSTNSNKTELAKCECCGLGEECTQGYVMSIKNSFCGHFVCGLCSEAVKEEHRRLETSKKTSSASSLEEAVIVHMGVCKQFNYGVREKPLVAAANAMGQLLLRRSTANKGSLARTASGITNKSRTGSLARTASCMNF